MSDEKRTAYAQRINQVCDYISRHLDEELTVDRLSGIANFSKFHFHRQFSEYMGITVYRFIQLLRLKRASYQLAFNKHYRIIDIAYDAGFQNPESFSRAFKNLFGQSPSQFRNHPDWQTWYRHYQFNTREVSFNMEIKIVEFSETRVACLEHRGPAALVNKSASTFIEWRQQSGLSPVATSQTYGIAYDDPQTTVPDKFRFDICGSVTADVPPNAQGIITKIIPGGRCAMLTHQGSHDNLSDSVHYLYGQWLPGSGEQLRDFPCFFHYLNLMPEVPEHELVTDVYLPLK